MALGFVFWAGMAGFGIPAKKKRRELQVRVPSEALACPYRNTRLGAAPSWARLREPHSCTIEKCQFSDGTILRVNALNCQIA